MTGSTEAATEFVERATLLKTLRAIQSLVTCEPLVKGDPRYHSLKEKLQDLESTEGRVAPNRQIPHDLTRHVSPPNQHTPRAHPALLSATETHPTVLVPSHPHQPLATLISPAHNVSHRFRALSKSFEDSEELDFKKLDEILVAAIANQGGLVSDGLKVNLGPRTTHFDQLFWICENRVQGLRDLVNIHETHWNTSEFSERGDCA